MLKKEEGRDFGSSIDGDKLTLEESTEPLPEGGENEAETTVL